MLDVIYHWLRSPWRISDWRRRCRRQEVLAIVDQPSRVTGRVSRLANLVKMSALTASPSFRLVRAAVARRSRAWYRMSTLLLVGEEPGAESAARAELAFHGESWRHRPCTSSGGRYSMRVPRQRRPRCWAAGIQPARIGSLARTTGTAATARQTRTPDPSQDRAFFWMLATPTVYRDNALTRCDGEPSSRSGGQLRPGRAE
jgi:hypothetical protein